MAQAGYTPIQLYYSTTTTNVPSAGNLASGELAINITDGKLFYKDNGGVVRVIAGTGGTGVVAGSNTQVQFNNNGVFGASANLTFDGTTLVASNLTDSSLTSGRVTYATTGGNLTDSANLTFDGTNLTLGGGTANGVAYLNGSKVLTTGSALTFDGSEIFKNSGGTIQFNDVRGSSAAGTRLSAGGTLGTDSFDLFQNTTAGYVFNRANTPLIFGVNATEGMRLTSTGLGIGTSSPSGKLEVSNAGDVSAWITATAPGSASLNLFPNGGGIGQVSAVGAAALAFRTNSTERARISADGTFRVKGAGSAGSTDAVVFSGSAPATSLLLDSSGNLGLGVTPSGYLANKFVINTGTDSNNGITIASATNRNGSIWFADGTTGDQAYRGGVDYQHTTDTLYLYSGAQGNFQLTAAGNLGLGVTPSVWNTGFKALQVGAQGALWSSTSTAATWLTHNTFLNTSSSFRYLANSTASALQIDNDGAFKFYTAPSGTAGNTISFTQAMTLDASGNLGVGATSLGSFRFKAQGTGGILGGNAYFVGLVGDGSASNKGVGLGYDSTSQTGIVYGETASAASNLAFWTYSGSAWGERARITSGGNLLVGTTTNNASGGVIQVSNGITFPATQSASSDANTLDDYEQGTWTPVTKLGTTTQTASNALGAYTKIGNVVYFACQTGDLTKSGTGSLTISLPFTASSTGSLNRSSQALVRWNGINPGGVVIGYIDPGTATVSLQWFTTTGGYGGAVDNTHCSATYQLYGVSGFFYMD